MKKKEFMEMARQEILRQLPEDARAGLSLNEVEVIKINDQKHHGFCFQKEGVIASPTLYLDQAYDLFRKGLPLDRLMGEVARAYLESADNRPEPSAPDLSFDRIRDNLCLRLVETKRNREYLLDKPYLDVGNGLALVCDIRFQKDETESWRTVVNNSNVEANHYDRDELFSAAIRNAMRMDPPQMVSLQELVMGNGSERNLLSDPVPAKRPDRAEFDEPVYLISSQSRQFGAAALFYPSVKEQAADILGEGYTVLPSSLHEVLLVPDSSNLSVKDMLNMVRETNRKVVEPKDVLSDNIYHFDDLRGKLSVISPERGKEAR